MPASKKKNMKIGKIMYYLQTVGAAAVSPDHKEVLVLLPETIRKQDGEKKMDCERNAVRRFLGKLRQDHSHLQFIVFWAQNRETPVFFSTRTMLWRGERAWNLR